PMMRGRNSAIVALSYLGAVRAIPNYNVMGMAKASLEAGIRFTAACLGKEGIRCNGISAGPIKTLAASGIADFGKLLG
ncbi:SDR family oxidoreductase, partial [Streptococcus pneumoniae]